MKKKIFTLLTLALMSIGTAWAEDVTVGRTAAFSADTHANTLVPLVNSNLTVTIADGTQDMGASTANKSTKDMCYKSTTSVKFDAFLCYRTKLSGSGLGAFNSDAYAGFKVVIKDGMSLTISTITAKVATADDGTRCRIIVEDDKGNALQTSSDKNIDRNSGNDITVSSTLKLTGTVYVKMHYWTTKESSGAPHTSKYVAPVELTITGDLADDTAPTISASDATIKATTSGVEATQGIAVNGFNLSGSTLTATLSPAVDGLSVTLAENAITAGSISTTATLHYTKTSNVLPGSTTLTFSDGTTSKDVTVNYSAKVEAWTLQPISDATTWNWSKLTANTGSSKYVSSGIKLTAETTPKITDEFVLADYDGEEYTVGPGFDAYSISFVGEYPIRSNQFCQNGTVKFNTTVPGTIKVKFSDTGSSASATAFKRYLVVNGETTTYWTSRQNNSSDESVAYAAKLNVETEGIYVPAGDVTITGSGAIQIYYITFNPLADGDAVSVTDAGYATVVLTNNAYFDATPAVKAYAAKANGSTIDLTEVKAAPAGTALLIEAAQGNYTLQKSATAPADVSDNDLVAGGVTGDGASHYVLGKEGTKVGFGLLANGVNLPDTKAYISAAKFDSSAPAFVPFFFGDDNVVTGVNDVRIKTTEVKGEVYNLNGQRVAQPMKGLYIVNGRKVVLK